MCFTISNSSHFYSKYLKSHFPPRSMSLYQPNSYLQPSIVLLPALTWGQFSKDRVSKAEASVVMQSKDQWVSIVCLSVFSPQSTR